MPGKLSVPRSGVQSVDMPRVQVFLTAVEQIPSISAAATLSQVGRGCHPRWLRTLPGYREAFQQAWDAGMRNRVKTVQELPVGVKLKRVYRRQAQPTPLGAAA